LYPEHKTTESFMTMHKNTRYEDPARHRDNDNPTLDTSLGSGCIVTMRFANPLQAQIEPRTVNLALYPITGKLVVAAQTTGGAVVVRFNTNGTRDGTFGGGTGLVTLGGTTYPA